MSTILITGGTGMVGTALTNELIHRGHKVIIMSRKPRTSDKNNISYAVWNVSAQTMDAKAISGADYIVHLAGESVAEKRWTTKRKKEIIDSRTESCKLIIKSLQETPHKVRAVVSASAIGYYGDDKDRSPKKKIFTEEQNPDKEFLGETTRLWEESIEPVRQLGIRLVKLRIGIVLSNEGGAFPEFKKPVKFGIAGMLGSGKQIVSWIHIEDLCRMFIYAIEHDNVDGVYNAVAPAPVSNKELTILLANKMKGKFFIPLHVPAAVLELMLGQMSVEVLKSATVSAEKIKEAGFTFLYPEIEPALDNLVKSEV